MLKDIKSNFMKYVLHITETYWADHLPIRPLAYFVKITVQKYTVDTEEPSTKYLNQYLRLMVADSLVPLGNASEAISILIYSNKEKEIFNRKRVIVELENAIPLGEGYGIGVDHLKSLLANLYHSEAVSMTLQNDTSMDDAYDEDEYLDMDVTSDSSDSQQDSDDVYEEDNCDDVKDGKVNKNEEQTNRDSDNIDMQNIPQCSNNNSGDRKTVSKRTRSQSCTPFIKSPLYHSMGPGNVKDIQRCVSDPGVNSHLSIIHKYTYDGDDGMSTADDGSTYDNNASQPYLTTDEIQPLLLQSKLLFESILFRNLSFDKLSGSSIQYIHILVDYCHLLITLEQYHDLKKILSIYVPFYIPNIPPAYIRNLYTELNKESTPGLIKYEVIMQGEFRPSCIMTLLFACIICELKIVTKANARESAEHIAKLVNLMDKLFKNDYNKGGEAILLMYGKTITGDLNTAEDILDNVLLCHDKEATMKFVKLWKENVCFH